MKNTSVIYSFILLATALLLCSSTAIASESVIRLATTTSTENSGLLGDILPEFERTTNNKVHVIAVGTGKALRLLREGDVDVVLVHARAAEDKLIADGFGVNRKDVMYNDFVIVGDPSDPAKIKGMTDATAALGKIAQNKVLFVSRGDDSGTHKKEKSLWREAQLVPDGQWYREAGQGMGKVLQMTGELGAYTITDRGTWLAFKKKSPLEIMVQNDPRLFNPYGIIAINPKKYPDANYNGAMELINWITSKTAQTMIQDFKIAGQILFVPMALTKSEVTSK
ncbi:substrate-binding domain-containing protein [Kaarinaea lacus]